MFPLQMKRTVIVGPGHNASVFQGIARGIRQAYNSPHYLNKGGFMGFAPHGIVPAMVTPLDKDDNVNEQVLRDLVDHLIAQGVHGVFALGSQGEYFALDINEKRTVMETTIDATKGRVPVYIGTGATTTREAVLLTRMAEECGADAVSVITPSFISPNQDELYEHYVTVARATRLPVLLYTNPARTGINVSIGLAKRLAAIDNIVGIKDSSGDLTQTATFINDTPESFQVLAGRDTLILATLLYGGAGSIAATGNVAAALIVSIYEHYMAGDIPAARQAQRRLAPLRSAFGLGTFPQVIKEALQMIGIDAGPSRRPVGPLSDSARAELRRVLTDLDLLAEGK